MLSIKRIEKDGADLEKALLLFKEYFEELNENLSFQNTGEELENPLKKYGAPHGSLFIACLDGEVVGCIVLQRLTLPGTSAGAVCEMKRLYVKPPFRRHKVGAGLVNVLLEDAAAKGYHRMVLDTLERLQPAIRLYHYYGFQKTSSYYENPLPGVVYMEKWLV